MNFKKTTGIIVICYLCTAFNPTQAQIKTNSFGKGIDFIAKEKPEVIIDAAAKVGGILANNDFPYQFLMEKVFQDIEAYFYLFLLLQK